MDGIDDGDACVKLFQIGAVDETGDECADLSFRHWAALERAMPYHLMNAQDDVISGSA